MAHRLHTRNLGRNKSWRKATVRSLAQAVVKEERIHTTRAKAKEAQRMVERLITLGKKGTLSARRRALSVLDNSALVHRLFAEVAPRFQTRAGGYTRITQGGYRAGDGATMAVLELVELSPDLVIEPKEKQKGKEKGKEKVKPRAEREKPKAEAHPEALAKKPEKKAPAKQEVKEPEAAPAGEAPQQKERAPEEKHKPGLVEGLRKFFKKGREKP